MTLNYVYLRLVIEGILVYKRYLFKNLGKTEVFITISSGVYFHEKFG